MNAASPEFNEWCRAPAVGACVPAENDGIESSAGNPLGRELGEDGNEVEAVFEAAAAPSTASLAAQSVADKYSRRKNLRFRK